MELRVRLSTLLGLDRYPAEIAGWGFTHAEHARTIVDRHPTAQWKYAICDDHGALLHTGLVTTRPGSGQGGGCRTSGAGPTGDRRPPTPRAETPDSTATGSTRAVIEIQLPLSLLHHLHDHPDQHATWATVIKEIIGAITTDPPDRKPPTTNGVLDGRPHQGHDLGHSRDDGHDQGWSFGGDKGRDRRFPTAPMRRRVQTRDRTCAFIGCRMPAKDTDTDHLDQWTTGGRTQDHNLISLCRRDHRLKDHHGWKLTVQADGTLHWTSPLGLTHSTHRPAVINPLPPPAPRRSTPEAPGHPPDPGQGDYPADSLDPDDQEQPIWEDRTARTDKPGSGGYPGEHPGAETTPASLIDDEPPPF